MADDVSDIQAYYDGGVEKMRQFISVLSLSVIPEVGLPDLGLVDVNEFRLLK